MKLSTSLIYPLDAADTHPFQSSLVTARVSICGWYVYPDIVAFYLLKFAVPPTLDVVPNSVPNGYAIGEGEEALIALTWFCHASTSSSGRDSWNFLLLLKPSMNARSALLNPRIHAFFRLVGL